MVQRAGGSWRRREDAPPLRAVHNPPDNEPAERLPVPRDATLEGEVVPAAPAEVAPVGPRPREAVVRAVHVITDVAKHDRTRAAARHVAYVAAGAAIVARRMWKGRTTGAYLRGLDMALHTGDQEHATEWGRLINEARKDKRKDTNDRIELLARVVGCLPKVALGFGVFLLLVGVLLAWVNHDPAQIRAPFHAVAALIRFVVVLATIVWGPLLLAAPVVAVLAFWHVGRRQGTAPAWAATAADADIDVAIDEMTITGALAAMRIPQITAYLKKGLPLQFITPCRVDGRGTHAVIRLPAGVPAERIARRRKDLATGLHRLAKETWPTTGSEEGILDLWIADKGVLAEGAGPYPLLDDGLVDIFKGVPFGRTLRGDPIVAPLMERNTITGGMPGQGKSSAARAIMAGCALDPTAELRIWIPDSNFDFEAMKPRCSRYVMGAEEDKIAQIRDDLVELYEEVQTRGQLLIQHRTLAVTRQLADAGIGLHPLVCLLEEAHIGIQHPKYGKEISQLLIDIVRLGRKRGIHVIVSTQAPTKDSMPRDVTRNCSNGIAFAVGDHVANDALLGQGAYAGGHRATELIPGVDRGTAVCKGLSGERSEIVQVYFLDASKGSDQVTPIIDRALEEIARRGVALPGPAGPAEVERRDLLDDLDEVMGAERAKLTDLVSLLRNLAPHWQPYRSMNGKQLRAELEAAGVRVLAPQGYPQLDPADLRRVLVERSTTDLDER